MKREDYNSRMSRLHSDREERPKTTPQQTNHQIPKYSDQENEQARQRLINHGQRIHSFNEVQKRNKRHKIEKAIGVVASIATIIACIITYIGYRQNNKPAPVSHDTHVEKVYDKSNPSKNSPKPKVVTKHDKPNKDKNQSNKPDSSDKNNDSDNNNDQNVINKAKQEQKDNDASANRQQEEQEIDGDIQKSQQDAQDAGSSVKSKLNTLKEEAKNGTLTSEAKNDLNNIHNKFKGYEQSNTPNNTNAQNSTSNANSNNN